MLQSVHTRALRMPPSSKAKPPSPKPPPAGRSADKGGGALGRARQFAASRGLPPPEVDAAKPAPAKKKTKPAAKETRR
jgi:hypothetical protein